MVGQVAFWALFLLPGVFSLPEPQARGFCKGQGMQCVIGGPPPQCCGYLNCSPTQTRPTGFVGGYGICSRGRYQTSNIWGNNFGFARPLGFGSTFGLNFRNRNIGGYGGFRRLG